MFAPDTDDTTVESTEQGHQWRFRVDAGLCRRLFSINSRSVFRLQRDNIIDDGGEGDNRDMQTLAQIEGLLIQTRTGLMNHDSPTGMK
jgi:hypothetical protein